MNLSTHSLVLGTGLVSLHLRKSSGRHVTVVAVVLVLGLPMVAWVKLGRDAVIS